MAGFITPRSTCKQKGANHGNPDENQPFNHCWHTMAAHCARNHPTLLQQNWRGTGCEHVQLHDCDRPVRGHHTAMMYHLDAELPVEARHSNRG